MKLCKQEFWLSLLQISREPCSRISSSRSNPQLKGTVRSCKVTFLKIWIPINTVITRLLFFAFLYSVYKKTVKKGHWLFFVNNQFFSFNFEVKTMKFSALGTTDFVLTFLLSKLLNSNYLILRTPTEIVISNVFSRSIKLFLRNMFSTFYGYMLLIF